MYSLVARRSKDCDFMDVHITRNGRVYYLHCTTLSKDCVLPPSKYAYYGNPEVVWNSLKHYVWVNEYSNYLELYTDNSNISYMFMELRQNVDIMYYDMIISKTITKQCTSLEPV